tara:strand:+ start:3390 stop:3827 length:438 start_codon:yes stop_codon:yes gene_type:complete
MSSINQVNLVGRVGSEPESRSFANGGGVTNLRLATSEKWKDKDTGEWKERTDWHTVAAFGGLAKVLGLSRKGQMLAVVGQLRTRKWQDQNGSDRWSTEVVLQGPDAKVVLLGQREAGSGAPESSSGQPTQQNNNAGYPDDNDIPF